MESLRRRMTLLERARDGASAALGSLEMKHEAQVEEITAEKEPLKRLEEAARKKAEDKTEEANRWEARARATEGKLEMARRLQGEADGGIRRIQLAAGRLLGKVGVGDKTGLRGGAVGERGEKEQPRSVTKQGTGELSTDTAFRKGGSARKALFSGAGEGSKEEAVAAVVEQQQGLQDQKLGPPVMGMEGQDNNTHGDEGNTEDKGDTGNTHRGDGDLTETKDREW